MKRSPKHDALTFALTEGAVGPGCKAGVRGTRRVNRRTVDALVRSGHLFYVAPGPESDGWCKLTDKGEELARRVFASVMGFEHRGAPGTLSSASGVTR
jgi:hypothetical protein